MLLSRLIAAYTAEFCST